MSDNKPYEVPEPTPAQPTPGTENYPINVE